MDKIYSIAYDMISNIPFNGSAVVYSDLTVKYTTNDDGWIYNHNDDNVKPIFNLNLSESYWLDYFSSCGVNLRDDLYNDGYEQLINMLTDDIGILIYDKLKEYKEGND